MKPTPFDVNNDFPPIPFEKRHCLLAQSLKAAGLPWKPHVGCFVWDRSGVIPVPSPFPEQVYFILNLGHFLKLIGTLEKMADELVWLPTWHQTRLICTHYGVPAEAVAAIWKDPTRCGPGEELLALYALLLKQLNDTG